MSTDSHPPTAEPAHQPELLRSIGRWSLAALVLNGIIGTGVFILPGTVGGRLGWLALWAWALAALITGAMVFCFAEVASRFTSAGGAYLYTQAAFGRFVGVQIGWMTYFARAISAAVQANLFSTYLGELWPWAGSRVGGIVISTAFIGALAAINIRGVASGARVSDVLAIVKLAPLVLFGGAGMLWLAGGRALAGPPADASGLSGWLQVLLLLMFAYGGFESALIPLGEVRQPQRDAPFALILGLALVTVVYLATQVAVLATLESPGASERPLAASARVLFGPGGAWIMTTVALLSVYGWLASNMLNVPRLTLAMAERGDLPAWFGTVHPRFHTPHVSILLFALLSWGLANSAGLLQNLSLSAVSRLAIYGLVCAALPVLRRRQALGSTIGAARFRAPMGTALALVSAGASLLLATQMNTREALTMGVLIAVATVHWAVLRGGR